WRTVATSDDRIPYRLRTVKVPIESGLSAEQLKEYRKLLERRQQLEAEAGPTTATAAYWGVFTSPEETYRLHRGDPMQKKEAVGPGALAEVGPKLELPANATEQQRRLALARWITDRSHPLTARVLVNRLWQHHFGQGIVRTPSDFGHNGDRPSHPELLDYL